MQRYFNFAILFSTLIALASCYDTDAPTGTTQNTLPQKFIFPIAPGNSWTYQYSRARAYFQLSGIHIWRVLDSIPHLGWNLIDARHDTVVGSNPPYVTIDSVYFQLLIKPDSMNFAFPEWTRMFPVVGRIPTYFTSNSDTLVVRDSLRVNFLLYETAIYRSGVGLIKFDSEVGTTHDRQRSTLTLLRHQLK